DRPVTDGLVGDADAVVRRRKARVRDGRHPPTLSHRPSEAYLRIEPPAAPAVDVLARVITEIGGADHENLETVGPGLVAPPGTGRDAHRVPLTELDDLVVELHSPAAPHHHVHLLLRLVAVTVGKAAAGRNTLVGEGGPLELERLRRRAKLQLR